MKQAFSVKHKEVMVGAFVLTALFIFLSMLVLNLTQRGLFKDYYQLRTKFSMGIGINRGTSVMISGYNIGTVKDVILDDEGKILLLLKIERKYKKRIRKNSVASIRRINPAVGDKFINICQGTNNSPILKDGELLKSVELPELETVLEKLLKITSNVEGIIEKVSDGNGFVGELINNRSVLDSLNRFLTYGYKLVNNGTALMHSAKHLTDNVDDVVDSLPVFVNKASNSVDGLDRLAQNADLLIKELSTLLANIKPVVDDGKNVLFEASDVTHSIKNNWLIRGKLPKHVDEIIYEETRE